MGQFIIYDRRTCGLELELKFYLISTIYSLLVCLRVDEEDGIVSKRKTVGQPVLATVGILGWSRQCSSRSLIEVSQFLQKNQKFLELVSLKINNLRSSTSRSQMSSKTDTVNKEKVSVTNVSSDKNWQNWNLLLIPQNKIYKKTTFSNISFISNYTIKTVERTYSLKQSFETIQLLNSNEINKNIKNFSFIHFGLV